jgi:hypothetical protein
MESFANFLAALLDRCEGCGLVHPYNVTGICGNGAVIFIRVQADASMKQIYPYSPMTVAPPLPISITVSDAKGERMRGHIRAEKPDTLEIAVQG